MTRPLWSLLALLALVTACTPSSADDAVTVFAASSLTEAFTEMAADLEAQGTKVRLNFAGSQVLRLQIEQGARPDVFASANDAHMASLAEDGLVREPALLAHNELVVIAPKGAPIATLEEFAQAPKIVLGTPEVPVGAYTREMLDGAGLRAAVEQRVVSEETNVRLVRAKIELGEADAAVVYRTDAVASDRVAMMAIPADVNVRANYRIALVVAGDVARANRFIDWALGARGRETLERHGFTAAPR